MLSALLFPLVILWFVDNVKASAINGSGIWAYVGIAIVYIIIAVTNQPTAVYSGVEKLGVGNKAFRVLIFSATLFTIGVPIGELGSTGYALAMIALVTALGLFLWAVVIALFGRKSDFEIARPPGR